MMLSRKWILAGAVFTIVAVVGLFLLNKSGWIQNRGKSDVEADSLDMIETVTPEIAALSENIHRNPKDHALYYARANAYYEFGNVKYALLDYQAAYQMDSTNANYALGFSDCLFDLNNAEGAIAVLEDYRLHDGNNVDVLVTLAVDYFKLPKPEMQKSIALLDEAIKLDVQNPDAYFFKGMIFKESGDTARAISSFQTTVEVDPDFQEAYMQLGNLYAAQKNKLALQYYDDAIRLDSTDRQASYAKAKFYQDIGSLSQAIADYKAMIVKDPQDADAIYNLATIYYGIDSIATAYKYYELAIRQAPANAISYYGKGLCAEELKKRDEAISLYTQALNLDPDLQEAEKRLNILNAQ